MLDSGINLIDQHFATVQQWDDEPDLQNKYSFFKAQMMLKANRQKDAIELNFKALARAEKNGDTLAQMVAKNTIGWAYMELDQNRDAINWFYRSINTSKNPVFYEKYNFAFSNIAATYNTIGKNDSAEYFIKQALYYSRIEQNLQALANSLAIQADIFIDTKRNAEAEASLSEALEIRKQIGDPFYVLSDMTQLAIYYAHNNQPAKGIALCKEGIRLAHRYNLSSKLSILYNALADNYKAAGDYQQYGETLQLLIAVKDSVYKSASAEALAGLQTKYDMQKKENTIMQQQFALERKNYWLYGSIIFSLMVLASLFLLFKSYRRKQLLRLTLMQEEEKRNSERAVVTAEEGERKRIAADLHDSLGAYAASIASNIQQLEESLASDNNTILHELRNNSQAIVSQLSDTIWVLKKDALLLTSISDRVKLFIQRISPSYPAITIDVWEDIGTDHLLPPAQAFHLFQIIKEAISNALKHSKCTQITVRVEAAAQWQVMISDNGRGIYKETVLAEGGNGIGNMKQRATESGWKIVWQTNQPKGTKVIIEPTTN
ncbi:MAG: hypothetical protein EON98_09685 [Chitinophagaceae bacterium]|nr:MAG: hypothetical protein EON98_09685 [Chitinophagaceae bacterium]